MNQKAKDYIKSNTLDLESNNRMDTTGYVKYAVSAAKAYGAILITEEEMRKKSIEALSSVLENWVHGGDADCIIAEFEEELNNE